MEFIAHYSIEKDIENHLDYGYEFKGMPKGRINPREELLNRMNEDKATILRNAKTREEAYIGIKKYLGNPETNNIETLLESANKLTDKWSILGNNIVKFLEFLYQKPFPFGKITVYLTTHNNCPYNYEEKYFFVDTKFTNTQLETCLHELNHFMFYYYYPNLKNELGKEKYDLLKESLTFFSNPSRGWYPKEEPLRRLYRSKIWENMEQALFAGVKLLKSE